MYHLATVHSITDRRTDSIMPIADQHYNWLKCDIRSIINNLPKFPIVSKNSRMRFMA